MYIGYARVSTHEQTLALQHDALRAAKCELVFEDTISGVTTARPGLDQALSHHPCRQEPRGVTRVADEEQGPSALVGSVWR